MRSFSRSFPRRLLKPRDGGMERNGEERTPERYGGVRERAPGNARGSPSQAGAAGGWNLQLVEAEGPWYRVSPHNSQPWETFSTKPQALCTLPTETWGVWFFPVCPRPLPATGQSRLPGGSKLTHLTGRPGASPTPLPPPPQVGWGRP